MTKRNLLDFMIGGNDAQGSETSSISLNKLDSPLAETKPQEVNAQEVNEDSLYRVMFAHDLPLIFDKVGHQNDVLGDITTAMNGSNVPKFRPAVCSLAKAKQIGEVICSDKGTVTSNSGELKSNAIESAPIVKKLGFGIVELKFKDGVNLKVFNAGSISTDKANKIKSYADMIVKAAVDKSDMIVYTFKGEKRFLVNENAVDKLQVVRVNHGCCASEPKDVAEYDKLLDEVAAKYPDTRLDAGNKKMLSALFSAHNTGLTPAELIAARSSVKPVEAPSVVPVPKPVEAPAVVPVEVPVAKPVEAPAVVPVEVPVAKPVEAPAVVPVAKPVEAPAVVPVEVPVAKPVDMPADPAVAATAASTVANVIASITNKQSGGAVDYAKKALKYKRKCENLEKKIKALRK